MTAPQGPQPPESEARPRKISASMFAEPDDERVDFERGISYWPVATLAVIAINVVVFIWELATNALKNTDSIIGAGALQRDRVLHGEVWRMGSATFLHGGPDHLIGNMAMLYVVGIGCEHALGKSQFGSVYVQSALAGSMLSALASSGPSVGASGAVFGVMASVVTMLVMHRDRIKLRDYRVAVVLTILIVYQLVVGLASPFVDNFAHLGGALGGIIATLRMKPLFLERNEPTV